MKPRTDRIPIRPCTMVYVVLMGLTLLTWTIGSAGLGGLALSLTVLAVALLKGHLVGDYFMGLARVSGAWRWVVIVWLLVPGLLVSIAFYMTDGG